MAIIGPTVKPDLHVAGYQNYATSPTVLERLVRGDKSEKRKNSVGESA